MWEPCNPRCGPCSPCCEPCSIPYGQSSESSESSEYCLGAELEAIPQCYPDPPPTLPDCEKKSPKRKRIIPLLMEPSKRVMIRLPKTRITKKIKADVLYSTWQCCKRNGLQDEQPQWLVLGKPYKRPGPSYRYRVAYYPSYKQCRVGCC